MNGKVKTMVEPKVISKKAFKIIGLAFETTMAEKDVKIPRLVEEFHTARIVDIENRVNAPVSYGMFIDPPNWNPETEPFTWMAGVEVDSHDVLPPGMVARTFPDHQYATLQFNPAEHEFDPYQFLHKWIKQNGYEQIKGFGFELYEPYTGSQTMFTLHFPVRETESQD
ncbi:GyrI-like domain-containing protein [Halobacillus sp. MO56]